MSKKFVVVDTETTGFYDTDDVLQIGVMELDSNLNVVSMSEDYFNTNKRIKPEVANITGLNNNILTDKSGGLYFEDKIEKYGKYLWSGDYIWIGHNIDFDIRMLNSNLERHGFDSIKDKSRICTMTKYKKRLNLKTKNGRLKNPKLGELYDYAVKSIGKSKRDIDKLYKGKNVAHDAMYDVFMTYISLYFLR